MAKLNIAKPNTVKLNKVELSTNEEKKKYFLVDADSMKELYDIILNAYEACIKLDIDEKTIKALNLTREASFAINKIMINSEIV